MLDEDVRQYLKQIGSKGGKATGGAKAEASKENGKRGWWSAEQANQWTSSEKARARYLSVKALKSGTLVKLPCSQCGDVNSCMHHPDYHKPLEVVWLCRKCHRLEHDRLRALAMKQAQLL